jgi:alpha-amylase
MKLPVFFNMRVALLAISVFLFSLCTPVQEKNSAENIADFPHAVTYEIFVRSFADSDGDGIGDIIGMTQKLDYLQKLGIQGIWLMPIMPSPTYHKYDVTDYKDIHPDYGTLDDFKTFVQEAHARNIAVVIDMIINHTSNEHPWFMESSKGKGNPYRDYYVWADEATIEEVSSLVKEATGDSDNREQWHSFEGQEEKYYGFFWGGMPDLNFDNPKVREEIYDIGRFWLEEVGVDGFRLDAAKHIFEDHRAEDNHAFWIEFRHEMQKIKPDVYLVGEVWADTETLAPYLPGLPSMFNFDLAFSILHMLNHEKNISAMVKGHSTEIKEDVPFEQAFVNIQQKYKTVTSDFVDAIFLSNHDQNRIMSVLGNDMPKAKQAVAILLSLPGTPYLYYGEEIGMKGMKPDPNIREPFIWDILERDNFRTRWIEPEYTTDATVIPLAIQQNDPNSLYNLYKELIALRNLSPALTFGEFSTSDISGEKVLAWEMKHANQEILAVHNISSSENAEINLKTDKKNLLFKSHTSVELLADKLILPPNGSIFILL